MFYFRIRSKTYATINEVAFCKHLNSTRKYRKPRNIQHQKKPHTKSLKVAIAAWLCACCLLPINRKKKLEIRPRPPNWNHAAPSIHKMKILTKNKSYQRILNLCDKLIWLRNESRGFRISQLEMEWKKRESAFWIGGSQLSISMPRWRECSYSTVRVLRCVGVSGRSLRSSVSCQLVWFCVSVLIAWRSRRGGVRWCAWSSAHLCAQSLSIKQRPSARAGWDSRGWKRRGHFLDDSQ